MQSGTVLRKKDALGAFRLTPQPSLVHAENTTRKPGSSCRLAKMVALTLPMGTKRFTDCEQDQKGGLQECLMN